MTIVRDTAIQLAMRMMETETDFIFVKEGEISHWPVKAKVKLVAEKMREVVADRQARLAIVTTELDMAGRQPKRANG